MEHYAWLVSVIGAHSNHRVLGRIRLQKTVWFLQRLGLPTDYSFRMHFYGPYSEDVQADLRLVEKLGAVSEQVVGAGYEYVAEDTAFVRDVGEFKSAIGILESTSPIVLELASTLDWFLDYGYSLDAALDAMRQVKHDKWAEEYESLARELLAELGLVETAA
ncbi:MAG: hypothetical protein Q8K99_00200 [Actinomycetota bacterium]|nr:hypothetical protein [Actinomycetota bacterium]